jgi:hypothetical protein
MKLIFTYFIFALFATMFILYTVSPDPEVIIKYPSPLDKVSDVYIDDQNVCYKYYRNEISKNISE